MRAHLTRLAFVAVVVVVTGGGTIGGGSIGNGTIGGGSIGSGTINGGGGSGLTPMFDLDPADFGSGPLRESSTLIMNGTTMTLLADYDARDISGTNWPARGGVAGTLAEAGSGGSPTAGQPTPLTEAAATGVAYAHAKYHDGAPTSIGTDDYAYELLAKLADNGFTNDVLSDADSNIGIEVQQLSGGTLRLSHADGTTVTVTTPIPDQSWVHLMCFGDRSATLRCAVNGQAGLLSLAINARTASITSTNGFEIGAAAWVGATSVSSSTVVLARVWKCTGCLNTTAEMDSVSAARFAQVAGLYPQAATPTPTVLTRATVASLDTVDASNVRRIFYVFNGWIRTVTRRDAAGGIARIGVLAEPASTNLALRSATFDDATWLKATGAITANSTAAPDGQTAGDTYESTDAAGAVAHCATQAITLTAAAYTESVYLRTNTAITKAYIGDATIATSLAWFDLAQCGSCTAGGANCTAAVLTKQASVTSARAYNYGNNWCRIEATFTGTAVLSTMDVCGATADASLTYDDGTNGTADWIAWGAQVEQSAFATSYVATTSATVTRNKDDLLHSATGNSSTNVGTFAISYLCPKVTQNNYRFGTIGDRNTNGIFLNPDSDIAEKAEYVTGGVTQASLTAAVSSFADENVHEDRIVYSANDVRAFHDGVQVGSTDVVATMIADGTATVISVQNNAAGPPTGGQLGCITTRERAWAQRVTP